MNFKAEYLSYGQTNSFSQLVTDYLSASPALRSLYRHTPDIEGVKKAMEERCCLDLDRSLLVGELEKQYISTDTHPAVAANITSLLDNTTFTITTAHQPNIFTGHLYFIYKILHVIRVAEELNDSITGARFVPVFYMGSEDADIEELGSVSIQGRTYTWNTRQKGPVGRMHVDDQLISLIGQMNGQLSVLPFGNEVMHLIRSTYSKGKTIEQATFDLVNSLFGHYGLVVLLPDNTNLKRRFVPYAKKELLEQFSSKAVQQTVQSLQNYKIQATGRDINLFYMKGDTRERIEKNEDGFSVTNTDMVFSREALVKDFETHPERISPNVILRPLYQSVLLPDVVFIGGGGELAYWLELKEVFVKAGVPFPVVLLRNSFMIVPEKVGSKMKDLFITAPALFQSADTIIKDLVADVSENILSIDIPLQKLKDAYDEASRLAEAVDPTLKQHVEALLTKAEKRMKELEKKIFRAEKRKHETEQRQAAFIKDTLFPNGSLQERVDNFLYWYAVYGPGLVSELYQYSKGFEQEFCVVTEKG